MWMSYTPEYVSAEVYVPKPVVVEDNRSIKEKVWNIMDEYELSFDEKIYMMTTIDCESSFDIYAVNKNKNGSYDLGITQANTATAPYEISRACSFDLYCSVRKMASYYKEKGNLRPWVCTW